MKSFQGILVLDEQELKVRFVHNSAVQYLLGSNSILQINYALAMEDMALLCLAYFKLDIDDPQKELERKMADRSSNIRLHGMPILDTSLIPVIPTRSDKSTTVRAIERLRRRRNQTPNIPALAIERNIMYKVCPEAEATYVSTLASQQLRPSVLFEHAQKYWRGYISCFYIKNFSPRVPRVYRQCSDRAISALTLFKDRQVNQIFLNTSSTYGNELKDYFRETLTHVWNDDGTGLKTKQVPGANYFATNVAELVAISWVIDRQFSQELTRERPSRDKLRCLLRSALDIFKQLPLDIRADTPHVWACLLEPPVPVAGWDIATLHSLSFYACIEYRLKRSTRLFSDTEIDRSMFLPNSLYSPSWEWVVNIPLDLATEILMQRNARVHRADIEAYQDPECLVDPAILLIMENEFAQFSELFADAQSDGRPGTELRSPAVIRNMLASKCAELWPFPQDGPQSLDEENWPSKHQPPRPFFWFLASRPFFWFRAACMLPPLDACKFLNFLLDHIFTLNPESAMQRDAHDHTLWYYAHNHSHPEAAQKLEERFGVSE